MKLMNILVLFGGAGALAFSQYGAEIGWRTFLLILGSGLLWAAGVMAGVQIEREYPIK